VGFCDKGTTILLCSMGAVSGPLLLMVVVGIALISKSTRRADAALEQDMSDSGCGRQRCWSASSAVVQPVCIGQEAQSPGLSFSLDGTSAASCPSGSFL
jgi:hypothetical protein